MSKMNIFFSFTLLKYFHITDEYKIFVLLKRILFLILSACMCTCASLCRWMQCPWMQEGNISGAGVTSNCELVNMDAEYWIPVLYKNIYSLNCWASSAVPRFDSFKRRGEQLSPEIPGFEEIYIEFSFPMSKRGEIPKCLECSIYEVRA